jgi:hypothetical protein
MRWYSNIGRRVWIFEIWQWLFYDRRTRHGPTVGEFLKGGWKHPLTPRQHIEPPLVPARDEPQVRQPAPSILQA